MAEPASQPGSAQAGQLDIGANFSCAIVTGGQVRCWGYGANGELGYPGVTMVGASNTPAAVGPVDLGAGHSATAISSGDNHTCAILDDGSVRCWGYGADGRLGYGNTNNVGDKQTPGSAGPVNLGAGRTATAISAGGGHTCAILDNATVLCWGYGVDGQLGYGNTNNVGDTQTPGSAGPVNLGAGRTATAISAGFVHTCALLDNGTVLCWGYGGNGRLGYGNTNAIGDLVTPGSVAPVKLGAGNTAVAISAGGPHTCVILNDGSVRCWGFGFAGQLGYGNQIDLGDTPSDTPGLVGPVNLGAGRTAVAISAGQNHTCAILDNGSVLCWGYGADGRLGYGSASNVGDATSDTPGMIGPVNLGPGRTAVAISAGGRHTCARLNDGSVRCWGYGASGQLGYCGRSNVGETPTSIPGASGPVNLMPGDGGARCPPVPVSVSRPSIAGQAVEGQTLAEAHGSWSPAPTGYGYQWERCDRLGAHCAKIKGASAQRYQLAKADVGSTIEVLETASSGAATSVPASSVRTALVRPAAVLDAIRKRRLRGCLAKVTAGTKHARARCLRIWGRTPGRVTGLRAITRGKTKIELVFTAPGTDGKHPPAATSYLIKQSPRPIASQKNFNTSPALCKGACRFRVTQIGTKIKLLVTGLQPGITYYYAVAALDNVTARRGPRTPSVKMKTG